MHCMAPYPFGIQIALSNQAGHAVRSGGVSSGFRNAARLPFRSARDSQAAMLKASCWSPVRPSLVKLRLHSAG